MAERYSIGVDIGGTFTDLVMCDDASGRLYNEKVLTTPHEPSLGVLEGIDRILAAQGARAAEVRHVIHGTTLVANAVIERRGSRIALVTTRGFADLLEIGTEWRYDIYDLSMQVPEPLVPRRLRFEVPERLGPDGRVLIRGALWRARTNRATPIRAGEPIRVVAIDGLVLEVEPEEGGAIDYREMRDRRKGGETEPTGEDPDDGSEDR